MLIFVSLVLDVAILMVSGFCGMNLWNWFLPLIFETAPRLNLGVAVGLILTISCFVSSGKSYTIQEFAEKTTLEITLDGTLTAVAKGLIKPTILLGFGWILHTIIT